jgi:tRNA isopentenyl-2-thiomethyl-A-37 hydroxylase MiaE
VVLTREAVVVFLACAFRQLRVEGVEHVSHGDGVTRAPRARRVETAPRYSRGLKDETGRARRGRRLIHRIGVAGRVEARRRRRLNNVEVQLGWPVVTGIGQ